MFLAELNGLESWSTDIGNAYLEAETKEKVYIIAGPEFGELEGHTLIIFKALYGLKSSGVRWHEKFADTLRSMGFKPTRAEDDIWIRDAGDCYEYIAVYVDDLLVAAKDPEAIIKILESVPYNYKLKGSGPIKFHLGCDFFRDADGCLCFAPKKYVEKMLIAYKNYFGVLPKEEQSPLSKGDHPELDASDLLDEEGTRMYQSLIGAMQWAVTLGRIDITTAVMTMSSFRQAPRVGHLERCKRIYGYLSKFRNAVIRIRTEEPDYSDIDVPEYDWTKTIYGDVRELLPEDAPPPKGKPVLTTTYKDANLYHDLITGRAVTGILHLVNKTPIDWYSKKQSTVETATFGSEAVSARIATDQIIELRMTLRYLGVPVREKSYLFGDNESVVKSCFNPNGKLHKRHVMLSWHRVREMIAAGIMAFIHIPGVTNPADILSKHWAHHQVWDVLKPLLFWQGDTSAIGDSKSKKSKDANTD